MRTMGRRVVLGAALMMAAGAAGVVIAASAEDDLAVVKKAVARQEAPPRTPPDAVAAEEPIARDAEKDSWERRSEARARTGARDLRWFKVRITEKGSKKARVNVNVPIALVRALGDDFPIDVGRHGRWGRSRGDEVRTLRLGEILSAREAGQSLGEIDEEDATVRIWVE